MRLTVLMVFVVAVAACSPREGELVFLTRGDCVQTDAMRANLDAALVNTHSSLSYRMVDLASLPPDDARRGYPTPTVLYDGRDLYGMPVPVPPLPEPT